jgi:hypothetical protein
MMMGGASGGRRKLGVVAGLAIAAVVAAGCTPGALVTPSATPGVTTAAATAAVATETAPARPADDTPTPLPQTATATAGAATTAAETATLPALPAGTGLPELAPTGTPGLTGGEAQGGPAPQELVAMAVADLGQRTGAAAAEVQVVSSEAVLWADGSLGCPERGVRYTMAEVSGYRIVLGWQGQEYDYRTGEAFVRLCEGPRP